MWEAYEAKESLAARVSMMERSLKQVLVRRASTLEEIAGLLALRREVFVQEQGVPEELEVDDYDVTAVYAMAWDGWVVGTGRLILMSDGEAQIGRMAVHSSSRRRGIGGQILQFLEEEAQARGVQRILLHAQTYVASFYAQHDYQKEGEPFMEAGISHLLMRKTLT